jgi:hypothetical protein
LKYENADIEDGASGDISEDEFDRMSQVIWDARFVRIYR